MLIQDILNEDSPLTSGKNIMKKIAILSGRFQPPHIGHMNAWQHLRDEFTDAYIATTSKIDLPHSPFDFQEKKAMFMHAGVPSNRVVQVSNPYMASEIVDRFDENNTIVVFGVSEKDMAEDRRFRFNPRKDGSTGFLQPYRKNINDLQPVSTHAYVTVIPTFKFKVNGKNLRSATEFRAAFTQADDSTQAKMITDLYGKYSDKIHALLRDKIV
jgi:hypothetical protein